MAAYWMGRQSTRSHASRFAHAMDRSKFADVPPLMEYVWAGRVGHELHAYLVRICRTHFPDSPRSSNRSLLRAREIASSPGRRNTGKAGRTMKGTFRSGSHLPGTTHS